MSLPQVPGVEFRLITGFTCYAVGSDGSVWSNRNPSQKYAGGWRVVSQYRRTYGARYCVVSLRENEGRGKVLCRYVHRLVLEAFSGLPEPGIVARHLDGNTANNRADNLAWGTVIENMADKRRHGTHIPNRKSPPRNAKLDDSKVRQIRHRRANGELAKDLATEFGVSRGTIDCATRRKSWKSVR